MSIKAYAKARGLEVVTVNGLVAGHEGVEQTWQAMLAAVAVSGVPRLVGFSCIDTFAEVLWLARRARQCWEGVQIALGNVIATLNYERILDEYDCFDFVVVGDGEVKYRHPFKFLSKITPCPGTPLYQAYSAAGYLSAEWPLGVMGLRRPASRPGLRRPGRPHRPRREHQLRRGRSILPGPPRRMEQRQRTPNRWNGRPGRRRGGHPDRPQDDQGPPATDCPFGPNRAFFASAGSKLRVLVRRPFWAAPAV
ncbi:cobalamin-dependent protein [Mycobacterium ostraviense]|uniref:cobalamin-dependent protein n=1 Tax=Mycobacterium ostraviense TaxID=2738409 RepID=UPI001E46107E|nr:cobalamin-dependent protein [Mycobacterium ostraviense]UGT94287.1 cobalamin-dependent protein [Mycobacterium ostraviense]